MEHCFQLANLNAFQFDLTYFKEIQFTEYTAQQEGKYDWHEDLTWTKNGPSRRKLSIVVQLSDPADYKGGLLELDRSTVGDGDGMTPSERQLRSRGTAIVFPSFVKHRVTPVLQGKRHSLVSWYEGPPFR
jgi:PKHD-type hydroxylase